MADVIRLTREEFRPGFDWVARELVLPEGGREAIFEAVSESLYDGLDRRLKLLRAAWPDGAQWPSGHAYLQELLRQELEDDDEWQDGDEFPDVSERELLKLLLSRFSHVAQRLYRNAQVHEYYADPWCRKQRPFIMMNRAQLEEQVPCGRGGNVLLDIAEGLRLMEELTCQHPACRCTFDPAKGKP